MPTISRPAISVLHSPHDEALGEKIANALAHEGHETRCLGEDPLSGDLLLEDGAAIVIWSNATLKLARLHAQAREALERGALIPVMVGGAPAPEGFEALPAVDLSGWGGDEGDPRWRFVIEEINLAVQRGRSQDGAVWRQAETAPLAAVDDQQAAPPDPSSMDQELLTQGSLYAENLSDGTDPLTAAQQRPIDHYWPDAPASPKKQFRLTTIPLVLGVGIGLVAAMVAAIMLGPSLLSSPPTDPLASTPDLLRDGLGTVAFVQPISPVEDEGSGIKAKSDFVVTSYREGAEPGEASLKTQPTEEFVSVDFATSLEEPTRLGHITGDPVLRDRGVGAIPVTPASLDDADAPDPSSGAAVTPEDIINQNPLGDYFSDCTSCPKMAALPGGSFQLGSPLTEPTRQEDEGPVMDITLARPFAMAASEVTYDQWDACFADKGCREYRPSDLGWGRGDHPVTNVSYEDALSYVSWLSAKTGKAYRLPSEAEWEFAARGGGDTAFGLGKDVSPDTANFNGNYPFLGDEGEFRGRTTPVASFAPNDFGLYDMHGNLWEWTADCWDDGHQGAPTDGAPVRLAACGSHVLKGGAWNSGGWRLRSAHRINKRSGARENDIGFRVARDLD